MSYTQDVDSNGGRGETQWQLFENKVKRLNDESQPSVQYKVLYIARHGQGVHNVAERQYSRNEWDVRSSFSTHVFRR